MTVTQLTMALSVVCASIAISPLSHDRHSDGPQRKAATTITVKLIGDANGYRFDPARIVAHVGDVVVFQSQMGGPHNVTFWQDSIPAGAASQLQANMSGTTRPLTGSLIINTGDSYTVPLAKLTPGTYKFYCLPHLALGMRGEIVVQAVK
jgi:plastocyanin